MRVARVVGRVAKASRDVRRSALETGMFAVIFVLLRYVKALRFELGKVAGERRTDVIGVYVSAGYGVLRITVRPINRCCAGILRKARSLIWSLLVPVCNTYGSD